MIDRKAVTKQSTPFDAMDRMYRLQRHFYDASRKFYLLGRDQLLNEMDVRAGERILEAGCGTARNLIVLARKNCDAYFYGLDASSAMLETARTKVEAARVQNIDLKTDLANVFSFGTTFGLTGPFDKVLFSYSLSMIPTWRESIDNALANLKPGGNLYIVDFYDQADLPLPFQKLLIWWLNKFHVKHWPGLIPHLESLHAQGRIELAIRPLFRRYSYIAIAEAR